MNSSYFVCRKDSIDNGFFFYFWKLNHRWFSQFGGWSLISMYVRIYNVAKSASCQWPLTSESFQNKYRTPTSCILVLLTQRYQYFIRHIYLSVYRLPRRIRFGKKSRDYRIVAYEPEPFSDICSSEKVNVLDVEAHHLQKLKCIPEERSIPSWTSWSLLKVERKPISIINLCLC